MDSLDTGDDKVTDRASRHDRGTTTRVVPLAPRFPVLACHLSLGPKPDLDTEERCTTKKNALETNTS